jgi:hypothetical protein
MNNKICYLINWPRELDMYLHLFKNHKKNEYDILINNDSINQKINFKTNVISKKLKKLNLPFKFLLNKKKNSYEYVISTGDRPIKKITIFSLLRFFYANTIGKFLIFFSITTLLKKIFKKPLSASNYQNILFDDIYIEKKIAKKVIKFPNSLDINLKHFPNNVWRNNFDFFCVTGGIDKRLISKKFPEKKLFDIGHPRFDYLKSKKILENKIKQEFKISKKILLVIFTYQTLISQNINTIKKLILFLKKNFSKYQIIFRPHPKIYYSHPNIIKLLKKEKIILDNDETRSYGNLLKGSSIIATDYGSAVLDAIYLDKKILNITWPNDKIIKKILKREECNDYLAKNHLVKINFTKNLNPKFKKNEMNYFKGKKYKKKINKLKTKLFGKKRKNLNEFYKLLNLKNMASTL